MKYSSTLKTISFRKKKRRKNIVLKLVMGINVPSFNTVWNNAIFYLVLRGKEFPSLFVTAQKKIFKFAPC